MNDFSEQSKNDTTDICRNFAKSRNFVLWKSKGIISTKYIIKFDTKTTWSLISSMEFLTSNKAEKMLTNFTKGYIKDV